MINVYLDDMRPCPKGFILARTVESCIELISSKKLDTLSLDHDLGFGKPSGYEVVKFMIANKIYAKKIIIHSANPFGRLRMFNLLVKNKPKEVELYIRPEPLFFNL
ncbi:cell division protein FtsJ [Paenibacillus filicis]|uniref:Cell division protein FtsJ n=1 Tax=Paenibacillus gyeongsangnamensis TaxID=3388067 RepID=A0ABT4QEP8_9BACL|nr:cyclic-phosphate processing receiver domain-containing protein [Paenibacillus filicis]MCZ8515330.1 cell division protein FtsJ [Paenibacillus filicis]